MPSSETAERIPGRGRLRLPLGRSTARAGLASREGDPRLEHRVVIWPAASYDPVDGRLHAAGLAHLLETAPRVGPGVRPALEQRDQYGLPDDGPCSVQAGVEIDRPADGLHDVRYHRAGGAGHPSARHHGSVEPEPAPRRRQRPRGYQRPLPAGQPALVLEGMLLEEQLARKQLEHRVAEELEELVILTTRGAVRQGPPDQRAVPEAVSDRRLRRPDGGGGVHGRCLHYMRPTARVTLCPPKPKELLRAWSTRALRASPGT